MKKTESCVAGNLHEVGMLSETKIKKSENIIAQRKDDKLKNMIRIYKEAVNKTEKSNDCEN